MGLGDILLRGTLGVAGVFAYSYLNSIPVVEHSLKEAHQICLSQQGDQQDNYSFNRFGLRVKDYSERLSCSEIEKYLRDRDQ